MVVCKYFLQGSCRYGQNCRFEHVYSSKYTYHANQSQQSQTPNTSDEALIEQVQTDIQTVLKGNQWILSCYSPFKEKSFPGIHDMSPEEARQFIYEAKANNNAYQAIEYINNLVKEAREKYERLLHPDAKIMEILHSLYNGKSCESPFGNSEKAFTTTPSSIFRSAVQSSQTNSIFNQTPQSNPKDLFATAVNQSVFVQNNFDKPQESAKSIFAQANQNAFQSTTQTQQNIFATTNQNATSIFATANNSLYSPETLQNLPFTQNVPFTQNSVFQKTEQNKPIVDDTVYTRIEELSNEEIEVFKSDSFKLGFIPEIAPPQELCVNTKEFGYF